MHMWSVNRSIVDLPQQESKVTTMKKLFNREVYIRLAEDQPGVVCTVKWARCFTRTRWFPLHEEPAADPLEEKVVVPKKRWSPFGWASDEE